MQLKSKYISIWSCFAQRKCISLSALCASQKKTAWLRDTSPLQPLSFRQTELYILWFSLRALPKNLIESNELVRGVYIIRRVMPFPTYYSASGTVPHSRSQLTTRFILPLMRNTKIPAIRIPAFLTQHRTHNPPVIHSFA